MKQYNYIYKITNLVNGKIYIGKHSTDRMDDGYMGSGKLLHKAYQKYGLECFNKEVIQFYTSEVELNQGEIYWIAKLNATNPEIGYNLTFGGDGGCKTEQTKRKISEALKGSHLSEETKRKVSEAQKGKPLSEETKRKISEAHKGKPLSEEHRRKISECQKGKHLSEECKRKMSKTIKGKKLSEETKRKIGQANKISLKGKHLSEEHKRKIKETLAGKPLPDETKQKISAAKKGKTFTEEHRQNIRLAWQKRKLAKLNQQTDD